MTKLKLLVCGGRDFKDNLFAYDQIRRINPDAIVHGKARGADSIAGLYGKEFGLPVIEVPANWDFYERAAGPVRNKWMLEYCQPDLVLALPGSHGTEHMIDISKKAGIEVIEFGT